MALLTVPVVEARRELARSRVRGCTGFVFFCVAAVWVCTLLSVCLNVCVCVCACARWVHVCVP